MKLFHKLKAIELKRKARKPRYFEKARSWADDLQVSTLVSLQRYKAAFYAMSALVGLSLLCLLVMLPLQRTELVVVHQSAAGNVWLTTTKRGYLPPLSEARIKAEIAHYVIVRASYDPVFYAHETQLVKTFSSPEVLAQYDVAQGERHAAVNTLGDKGYRRVHVNSVLLQDLASRNVKGTHTHHNLAQVNFVVTDHFFGSTHTTRTAYTALVSWAYQGVPDDPANMLSDWDGFQITKYVVQAVNQ